MVIPKKNSKVSVCVPAYNHEKYVEQTILSILNQSYCNLELLVIDDGSLDQTPVILNRLSKQYGFHLERQENQGLPRTLNRLIELASGDYITICASDDFWPKHRLEEQVEFLENNPKVDMVHGNVQLIDSCDNRIEAGRNQKPPVSGASEFLPLLLRKRRWHTGTIMSRRVVWEKVGFYDESIPIEDFDWFIRAVKCCNVGFLPSNWLYYRRHEQSLSMTQKGALKIVDSSYAVARKLGFPYGFIFIWGKSPYLYWCEKKAKRYRRCIYFMPFIFQYSIRRVKKLIWT